MAGCGSSEEDEKEALKKALEKKYKPQSAYTEKEFKALAALTVEGFNTLQGSKGTKHSTMLMLEGTGKNDSNMYPFVMVNVANCFACDQQKMDKAVWLKRKDNLMSMLPRAHKENPDLIFEIDEMVIDGTKVITVYDCSFIKTEKSTASSHGFKLFYNNGKIMMTITVSARSKPFSMAKNLEELKNRFTREEMKAAAEKVFKALKAKI
jgi:hypothetical protein